jgi:hypothetical protein
VELGVGLAPGGTGIIARTCARFLEAQVQAVVVGNRPGAGARSRSGRWCGRQLVGQVLGGPACLDWPLARAALLQPGEALICARSVDGAGYRHQGKGWGQVDRDE